MWIVLTLLLMMMPITMVLLGRKLTAANIKTKERYYRTARSLRDSETARYAHKICGGFYLWMGKRLLIVTIIFGLFPLRLFLNKVEPLCGIFLLIEISMLILAVPFTESALKSKFEIG